MPPPPLSRSFFRCAQFDEYKPPELEIVPLALSLALLRSELEFDDGNGLQLRDLLITTRRL